MSHPMHAARKEGTSDTGTNDFCAARGTMSTSRGNKIRPADPLGVATQLNKPGVNCRVALPLRPAAHATERIPAASELQSETGWSRCT